MRWMKTLMTMMALSFASPVFSHGGGHATVTADQAEEVAKYVAVELTEEDRGMGFGKLDESWREIPDESVGISKSGPGYYIVAMDHEDEERTLYILMSNTGNVYDVNFTGEFKGID